MRRGEGWGSGGGGVRRGVREGEVELREGEKRGRGGEGGVTKGQWWGRGKWMEG